MPKVTVALAAASLLALAPAAAKEKKPVDPNKKVCRSEVPTGSFMAKSTCHTVAEWAQIDGANAAAGQDTLDRTTRAGLGGSASAANGGR